MQAKPESAPAVTSEDHARWVRDVAARNSRSDASFALLFKSFDKKCFNYFKRQWMSDDDAEELTQRTFLKVHQSADQFNGSCRFETWLYRIRVNVLIDWKRSNQRRANVEDVVSNMFTGAANDDGDDGVSRDMDDFESPDNCRIDRMTVGQCISTGLVRMSKKHRNTAELLRLQYECEYSIAELSALFNRAEQSIKNALAEARKISQQYLAPCFELVKASEGHS